LSTDPSQPEFVTVDPQQIVCERIGGVIGSVVFWALLVLAIAGIGALGWAGDFWIWIFYASIPLLIGFLIFSLVWPPLEYPHLGWRLDDTGLEIRRGVFWKHQISVPLGRIQHADVSQGPLQRMFGLASLTVHTAASHYPSVTLDGLSHPQALQIRDRLILQNQRDSDV
jgi:membrane protein YdbS with pleckstrin-like domain